MIGWTRNSTAAVAAVTIAVGTLILWKLRVIDPAFNEELFPFTIDLYTEYYPMKRYGFEMLGRALVPHWDPYQLCGLPFLAVPHTGLLYPGNLPYLLFDTALAIDLVTIFHLVFAGVGMWLLVRTLGLGPASGFAAAASFAWSGWMLANLNQAAIVVAMSWLPMTLLLIERTVAGGRLAPVGLALSVACQVFNGATEIFLHNCIVAVLFAVWRLIEFRRRQSWRESISRFGSLAVAAVAGLLLSAPQLVPSLELVHQSVRGRPPDPIIAFFGLTAPSRLLLGSLEGNGFLVFGTLPVLGLAIAGANGRFRGAWWFSITLAAASFLLLSNFAAYELYYNSPLGSPFRYPIKFLHMNAFAQALLAALAIAQLARWHATAPSALWRKPGWLAACLLLFASLVWLATSGLRNDYLSLSAALFLSFGIASRRWIRTSIIAALLGLHVVHVFWGAENAVQRNFLRPSARPWTFDTHDALLTEIKNRAGHDRSYISPELRRIPGLTQKQGMLKRFHVSADYEALTPRRYADFFALVSGPAHRELEFVGLYGLGKQSQFRLMDLTSTRFYFVRPGEEADETMNALSRQPEPASFRLAHSEDAVRVYERIGFLPRAYFVARASVRPSGEVLDRLLSSDFRSKEEVVLEEDAQTTVANETPAAQHASGQARIVIDEPERVVIDVEATGPGYLVLTDAFYPGWRAHAGGQQLAIHRANYLFRAVRIEAGETQVTFDFRTTRFHIGLGIAAAVVALSASALAIRLRFARGDQSTG